MLGIQLLRIANYGGTAVGAVGPNTSAVFPEGQVNQLNLNQTDFRNLPSTGSGVVGSGPGAKAKIGSAGVTHVTGTTAAAFTYTASPTLVLEYGYLDNDGYFTVHLSSVF